MKFFVAKPANWIMPIAPLALSAAIGLMTEKNPLVVALVVALVPTWAIEVIELLLKFEQSPTPAVVTSPCSTVI